MKLSLAVFGMLLPPTSASAQTTFDNRLDLQYAADLWCSNATAALAEHGNIADWDVSRITEMYCLFSPFCGSSKADKSTCNPDIGSWDTSAVLYMSNMFWGASSFDKDISSWNTSAVISMSHMFYGATSFDKDLSSWDVSAALDMDAMFGHASSFDKGGDTSLSDCNKALIQASFSTQTSAWPPPAQASGYNSWGLLCTGVCGDGTALDAVTRKCEVSLGNGTEVLGGKCAVACSDNRRLEEAQEEGEAAAAASIVDGLLARHPDFVAKLRRANLDEEVIKAMLELGQDFRLPALA